MYELEAVMTPL